MLMNNHNKINQLTIRNNELKLKIQDVEVLKNKVSEKAESLRKSVITNICLAAFGQFILAPLIHPIIVLASLLFLAGSVIPGGIILIRRDEKVEDYEKEIDSYNLEIKENEKELEQLYELRKEEKKQLTKSSPEPIVYPSKSNNNSIKKSR